MGKFLIIALAACVMVGCAAAPSFNPILGKTSSSLAAKEKNVLSDAEQKALALRSLESLTSDAPDEPDANLGPDLGNFGKLEETLMRGARPTEKGVAELAGMGVKTIVDLENQEKPVRQEEAWAKKYGIRFVNIPLSVITPPSQKKVDAFLALASDPSNRPMYFHCMQGRDRTGCMAFCYRLERHGWKYAEAYAEMSEYKFHTYLLGLRCFLWNFAHKHQVSFTFSLSEV